MRAIIKKSLEKEIRMQLIVDVVGNNQVSAKEIMKRSKLSRDVVYYELAKLVKDGNLSIVGKITKKGQGMLNHYALGSVPFVAKTVEELEKIYPVGYFAKLRYDQRPAEPVSEKGPYDDMIAANPNLRKISAMFETRPELFKRERSKTEHRGIPSTFGMYNMIPSGII